GRAARRPVVVRRAACHREPRRERTCGPATPFTPPFASVADACSFPDTFPACDPLHAPVVVPHGGTVGLTPGGYRDVRVGGGAGGAGTLVRSGTYAICNLRASRGGQIAFRGPSTLYVTESLTGSNAARIGPEPGSGVSVGQVHVFLAGGLLRVSRRGGLGAVVCAPSARFRAGTRARLAGSFAAADMRFKRAAVGFVAAETAATATTTPPP